MTTHINGLNDFLFVKIDPRDRTPSDQVEIVSHTGDGSVVGIRSVGSRLVQGCQRYRAVESAVRIAGIGLRLRGHADAIPAVEEVVCVVSVEWSVVFRWCRRVKFGSNTEKRR